MQHFSLLENAELGKMSKNKKKKKSLSLVSKYNRKTPKWVQNRRLSSADLCVLFPYPRLLCCLAGEYLVSRALEMSWPADS